MYVCQRGPPPLGRDAIESCSGLEGAEATACFAYFGCDRQKVKQWFSVVAALEQSLAIPGAHMRRPRDTLRSIANMAKQLTNRVY